jgi:hypothetical protein
MTNPGIGGGPEAVSLALAQVPAAQKRIKPIVVL